MEDRYIARRRARFNGISGWVNIPYGTTLEARDGHLWWKGEQLCAVTSQNAYDFFSQDNDGQGKVRGALVAAIMARLERNPHKEDPDYQSRWNKVWESNLCQRYRRTEHEDHWIWNHDFFNAPIIDLQQIAGLIGAK